MTKQARKYVIYIILLVVFSALAVYYVLKDDAIKTLQTLASAKIQYVLLGFLLMIISYFLNALILMILTRIYNKKYTIFQALANYLIGLFFSGITPSSTGGQFAQAYTFSKQNVKVTNGASILLMAFIIHQIAAILFSGFAFIFKFSDMRAMTETFNLFGIEFDIISLSIVGFAINFFVLFGLFFFAFSKKLHFIFVHGGANLLKKLHIFKPARAEKFKTNMDNKVASFRIELKRLITNWKILIITLIIMFIDIGVRASFPYLMGLAISADMKGSFFDGICMTNFTNLITMMIPIPGAAGGSEVVFELMFGSFMGKGVNVKSITLLWRVFTFYINVIIGFLVFILYRGSPKKDALNIDSSFLHDVEILSLTDEINISLTEFKKLNKNKSRKKYRPKLLDEDLVSEDNVEEYFKEVKNELNEQLKKNENEVKKNQDGAKQ